MKKVHGLNFRADVTLPIEGGHGDGCLGISEGYIVTNSPIYVSLLGERKEDKESEALMFYVLFRLQAEPHTDTVGGL